MATTCQHVGRILYRPFSSTYMSHRSLSSAGVVANEKINRLVQAYEDIVGLSEVREAQDNVIQAEREFMAAQENRREKQVKMTDIQSRLRSISLQREKVKRGEQLYLDLVTEEHKIIQEELALEEDAKNMEGVERSKFNLLSSAVRESHERERARAERTKYWSLIGSVIGATIGILGTSANNYFRMKELRAMIKKSADQGIEFHVLAAELADTTKTQFNRMDEFLGELKASLGSSSQTSLHKATSPLPKQPEASVVLEKQTKEILDIVKRQDSAVEDEMRQIKELLALEQAKQNDTSVVYVGPQVEGLLRETQDNISWKIKLGSLATVTAVYAGVALGVAFISSLFKGS